MTMQSEAMTEERGINDDIGMLPGTIVRGNAPRLIPSATGSPRAWLVRIKARGGYEWKWLKGRFFDRVGRIHYWARLTNWPWKKKPYFNTKQAKQAAIENYEAMYKAFVNNSPNQLEKVCLSGLTNSFTKRLQTRDKHTKLTWEIVKHDRFPRIVCNRATKLPVPGEPEDRAVPTALRQIVVKMTTRQRLTVIREDAAAARNRTTPGKRREALAWKPRGVAVERKKPASSEAEADDGIADIKGSQPIERTVTEYVVLHQRMLRGVIGEWKIWGFTEPSTMASIARAEKYEKEMMAYEAGNASYT